MGKRIVYIAVILLLIGAAVFGWRYIKQRSAETAYTKAIELIGKGKFDEASDKLIEANGGELKRDKFISDVTNKKSDMDYKNTIVLYSYTRAQSNYNINFRPMETIRDYLSYIPDDYSGEFADEIRTFKENFGHEYDEYLEKEERERQERAEKEAEAFRKRAEEEQAKKAAKEQKKDEKSSDKKSVEDDYFNVDDYDDPEDFYEDYYDDFWDYYDAEEYFYKHHSYMNLE